MRRLRALALLSRASTALEVPLHLCCPPARVRHNTHGSQSRSQHSKSYALIHLQPLCAAAVHAGGARHFSDAGRPPRLSEQGAHVANASGAVPEGHAALGDDAVTKLFRGPWIKTIAFVVRLKVLQFVASGAAAFPFLLYLRGDEVETGEVVGAVLLSAFSGIASYALWFYGQRYVGELALVGDRQDVVRISVLDFWGRRQDLLIHVTQVVPPFRGLANDQITQLCGQMFLPLDVVNDRQYVMGIRSGTLHDKDLLLQLLDGRLQGRALSMLTQNAARS